ncbi:hypothetical protein C8R43DRAFT_941393 [Mycena crocata]|nr:hypothetical protein C8R43DRAFT_941393 [Mycena crocata]
MSRCLRAKPLIRLAASLKRSQNLAHSLPYPSRTPVYYPKCLFSKKANLSGRKFLILGEFVGIGTGLDPKIEPNMPVFAEISAWRAVFPKIFLAAAILPGFGIGLTPIWVVFVGILHRPNSKNLQNLSGLGSGIWPDKPGSIADLGDRSPRWVTALPAPPDRRCRLVTLILPPGRIVNGTHSSPILFYPGGSGRRRCNTAQESPMSSGFMFTRIERASPAFEHAQPKTFSWVADEDHPPPSLS